MSDILPQIVNAFAELDHEKTLDLTKTALKKGIQAQRILEEGLSRGLDQVGELFEKHEYFLAELMVATYIMEGAMTVLGEQLRSEVGAEERLGTIVFGTVEGDFHFIGKNIAISLLQAAGYEVIDLGEDVSPEIFVTKVQERTPDIVALSALLLTTVPGIGAVIDALMQAGLRDQVFIMIGGRPTSQEVAEKYGADAYCATAMDGVHAAHRFMESRRRAS